MYSHNISEIHLNIIFQIWNNFFVVEIVFNHVFYIARGLVNGGKKHFPVINLSNLVLEMNGY